jgi:hypothetical protein
MPDHGYRKASIKVIPCPSCGGKEKIPKEHLYDLRDFASLFSLKGHESPAKIESMISEVDTLDSVLRIARQQGACVRDCKTESLQAKLSILECQMEVNRTVIDAWRQNFLLENYIY